MNIDIDITKLSEKEKDEFLIAVLKYVKKVEKQVDDLKIALAKEIKKSLELENKYDEVMAKVQEAYEKEAIRRQKLFGVKSEKEKQVLNEAEKESNRKKEEKKVISNKGRKKGSSPIERFLKSIIEVKQVNVTPEEYQKLLEQEGYVEIGKNVCHKLEYVPGHFEMIEYVVSQVKDVKNDVILPTTRDDPFPNSYLTPSLASEILLNKYLFGIPLYRMEQNWNKQGIPLSRMNLANYVIDAAIELYPLYEAMKDSLINTKHKILHVDETTLIVLDVNSGKDKKRSRSYIWLYATSILDYPILIYDFEEDRKGEHPKEFLKDYTGSLEVDGYEGYRKVENVQLCCCWSHARRHYTDLIETMNDEQKKKSYAVKLLKQIDKIFYLDKKGLKESKTDEEYLKYRQTRIRPVVDKYYEMIEKNIDGTTGKLRTAMQYSLKLKVELTRFLDNIEIPLINNRAERGIKSYVMSRKNFLFAKSVAGAEASAVVMSVIQTAKENGLELRPYLTYLFENMYKDSQLNIDKYLPWNEEIQKKFSVFKSKREA